MKINHLTLKSAAGTVAIPDSLQATTLLFFMRTASCPICIMHVKQIQRLLPYLNKNGIDVLIVVPEGVAEAEALKARYQLTMPVLAGEGNAHALVGLNKAMLGTMQQSGTFLVDASGEILYSKQATMPLYNFNEGELRNYIARM